MKITNKKALPFLRLSRRSGGAFVVLLSVVAVISFLQNHWFVAMLIVAMFGLVLWVLYSILCHVNYLIIPLLLRW